jgi:hypothetical protein
MDNPTGLSFLSAVLNDMSYTNQISLSSQNQLNTPDVRELHKYLIAAITSGDSTQKITLPASLLDEPYHYDL